MKSIGWTFIFLVFLSACTKPAEDSAVASRCPVIRDVSHRPMGEMDFDGPGEEVNSGEFRDFYLHDRDGKFKVGLRKNWGGTLIYFGGNSANALDGSVSSRGVQVSFRDDARAFQGCAYNSGCASQKSDACMPHEDFPGWNPVQGGNMCGNSAEAEGVSFSTGLVSTVVPLMNNPAWSLKTCTSAKAQCRNSVLAHAPAKLRVSQSARFVKPGVLEVEVLATNLDDTAIVANPAQTHAMPALFANADLTELKNAVIDASADENRIPAATPGASEHTVRFLRANNGWVAYENAAGDHGVGLYWENRNSLVRAENGKFNSLRSNFPFTLPPHDSVQTRYYLLLGNHSEIAALAADLDKSLPPFGRIEINQVGEDTRTVKLEGWVLDNKGVTALELWINGKKVSDLELTNRRDDVCAAHPGYAMCLGKNPRVGFSTTYQRPEGQGCDVPVEIRAQDGDSNWRVIARKAIAPVQYN